MNNEKKYRQYGYRLAQARTKAGLMQKDVAKHLGVKDNVISYFENGDRLPSVEQYKELSKLFNVSADFLLGLATDFTTDDKLKFVCKYTGLSADSIKKIREYCVPDLSAVEANNIIKEDIEADKKYAIWFTKMQKDIINDFILSSAFNNIVNHIDDIKRINEAFFSYLAIYFGDFEYFYELQQVSEKTVHSMQLFLNEFEYDSIHGAFNDRFDLFSFKIQKAILNYADDLFVLNKFENNKIPLAFDWIKFTVWCSVNSVFQNNKTLNDIKIDINENTNQDFTHEIQQLKEIYDKFKKGGINGNDN